MDCGIPTQHVTEMVPLGTLVGIPEAPAYVRGMIKLRERIYSAVDLRARMGMAGRREEVGGVVSILSQRKQDHIRWLNELKASVEENRPFTLTTDPHKCEFGKWYDTFKTDNFILADQIQKFDRPHRKIHELAIEIEKMVEADKRDAALERIHHAWNKELKVMIDLFDSTYEVVCANLREILIVLAERMETPYCLVVDEIKEVRHSVELIDIEEANNIANLRSLEGKEGLVKGLSIQGEDVSIMLDVDALL